MAPALEGANRTVTLHVRPESTLFPVQVSATILNCAAPVPVRSASSSPVEGAPVAFWKVNVSDLKVVAVTGLLAYAHAAGVVPLASVKVHGPATSGSSAVNATALSDTLSAATALPLNVMTGGSTYVEVIVRWPTRLSGAVPRGARGVKVTVTVHESAAAVGTSPSAWAASPQLPVPVALTAKSGLSTAKANGPVDMPLAGFVSVIVCATLVASMAIDPKLYGGAGSRLMAAGFVLVPVQVTGTTTDEMMVPVVGVLTVMLADPAAALPGLRVTTRLQDVPAASGPLPHAGAAVE